MGEGASTMTENEIATRKSFVTSPNSLHCMVSYDHAILPRFAGGPVAPILQHPGHFHIQPCGKLTRRDFLAYAISAAVLAPWAFGQPETQTPSEIAERFRKMSEDYEKEGLAAPFKGITTNGQVLPGLFEIRPTGVSTGSVRNAAEKFIAALSGV